MGVIANFIKKYIYAVEHEERAFVRYPAHIPIEVTQEEDLAGKQQNMSNVSMGGMAFESNSYWKPGSSISICVKIPYTVKVRAEVVWCRKSVDHFDVGVRFLDSPKRMINGMIEEICQIEMYKMLIYLVQTSLDGEDTIDTSNDL